MGIEHAEGRGDTYLISWCERGAPIVKAPDRRFGSTGIVPTHHSLDYAWGGWSGGPFKPPASDPKAGEDPKPAWRLTGTPRCRRRSALFPIRLQIAIVLLIQVNSSIDHECKIIA
jgi:hypothetical protein